MMRASSTAMDSPVSIAVELARLRASARRALPVSRKWRLAFFSVSLPMAAIIQEIS